MARIGRTSSTVRTIPDRLVLSLSGRFPSSVRVRGTFFDRVLWTIALLVGRRPHLGLSTVLPFSP